MILWIVEDDDMHLSKILQALEKEFAKIFDIFVNRDIAWPKDEILPVLKPHRGGREAPSPQHLPDVVILDLLLETKARRGEPAEFAGGPFYERLRLAEQDANKRRSQVIVYSQFRGLACTENFVKECCAADHHFDDVIKSPALLMEKLRLARQKVLDGE
jgi:hypothetical protein